MTRLGIYFAITLSLITIMVISYISHDNIVCDPNYNRISYNNNRNTNNYNNNNNNNVLTPHSNNENGYTNNDSNQFRKCKGVEIFGEGEWVPLNDPGMCYMSALCVCSLQVYM